MTCCVKTVLMNVEVTLPNLPAGHPDWREIFQKLYQRYAPVNAGRIEEILAKYQGWEPQLFQKFLAKRGMTTADFLMQDTIAETPGKEDPASSPISPCASGMTAQGAVGASTSTTTSTSSPISPLVSSSSSHPVASAAPDTSGIADLPETVVVKGMDVTTGTDSTQCTPEPLSERLNRSRVPPEVVENYKLAIEAATTIEEVTAYEQSLRSYTDGLDEEHAAAQGRHLLEGSGSAAQGRQVLEGGSGGGDAGLTDKDARTSTLVRGSM